MTTVNVIFSVYGENFDPDEITNEVGITPSQVWMKGDPISGNPRKLLRRECCWMIATGYQSSLDVEDQIQIIYKKLLIRGEELVKFIRSHSLSSKFEIVVKIENDQVPGLFLSRETLDFAHDLRAVFDIDLYTD